MSGTGARSEACAASTVLETLLRSSSGPSRDADGGVDGTAVAATDTGDAWDDAVDEGGGALFAAFAVSLAAMERPRPSGLSEVIVGNALKMGT